MSTTIYSSINYDYSWFRIPTEIRQHILLQLPAPDLIPIWIIKSDRLIWRELLYRSFPTCDTEEDWLTWRLASQLSEEQSHASSLARSSHRNKKASHSQWASIIDKHIDIDWWQIFCERVQLDDNWRQGRFTTSSVSLSFNELKQNKDNIPSQLSILNTRAWGTLFAYDAAKIWAIIHVAGQPVSPLQQLDLKLPSVLLTKSATIHILSTFMTAQGSVIIHGRPSLASTAISSEENVTEVTEMPSPADYLWLYQLNGIALSYHQCIEIKSGSRPMTHCICDLDDGSCRPVLTQDDIRHSTAVLLEANQYANYIELETDIQGAVIADTAHLHHVDHDKVQIFQCRGLSRSFCWELVEHTVTTPIKELNHHHLFSSNNRDNKQQHNCRQTQIIARGMLPIPNNGPLRDAKTTFLHESMVLLEHSTNNNNYTTTHTCLSALCLNANRFKWEFNHLFIRQVISLPEQDLIVLCDAKKRYLIRQLEYGLPRYEDSWPVDAQLKRALGSIVVLEKHGQQNCVLLDVITGNKLTTLSMAESSSNHTAALITQANSNTLSTAVSSADSSAWRPSVVSPVHIGCIDTELEQFNRWLFA
ncbi:hypothetical protein BDF19DRAFT_436018 [Syncephalis fuscata]|nr:hypothetical protein BDF19DRAFT_436018 [Syncephalis fuscata]